MIHAFITSIFSPAEKNENGRGTGTWSLILAYDYAPGKGPRGEDYAVANTASGVIRCHNAGQACFDAFRVASRIASINNIDACAGCQDVMVLHTKNEDLNSVLEAALDRHETDRYDYFDDYIETMPARLCPWPYGRESEDHMFKALEATISAKS